ncbi:MAG: TIGR03960 family B12-binding radical SAM protein [Polyangiales bacterium]
MPAVEHPYTPFLHRVQKPAQYLGGEPGETRKDWASVDATICLAFPDLYEIGMSHLGYKILYGIVNAHPKLLAERAYAAWPDMEAELRAHGEPLRSLESARPLRDFDVVGFSLQFELTYTNILQMLDLGGVPLLASERGEDDPLVVAGGPCATHGEILSEIVDCFLVGDGEEKVPELLLVWSALRRAGMPRHERLAHLATLGGFYVPSLYPTHVDPETGFEVVDPPADPRIPYPVKRAFVEDLTKQPFPVDGPTAATETIFDRVAIELARGCTEGCRFCQAGMIYRPVRQRDPEYVVSQILEAVRRGGYDEASLTSLSTADYSAIAPLVRRLVDELRGKQVELSVSSLRAYGLSEDVLDDMKAQRAGGLTFAPEAGSQRMRDVINKNVTEAQLLETAERVFSRGFSKMKLYFMIGLPTEADEDVRAIVETGARTLEVGRRWLGPRGSRVTVAVSTFVPKPHTPFQWCAMDGEKEILRKQRLLREAVRGTGVKLRAHDSAGSFLEGVMARADRRIGRALLRAYRLGARFDSWDQQIRLDLWKQAFADESVDVARYLGTLPVAARLPWDHLDVGLEEGFLAREYRKALASRLSPPCGKVAGAFVHATNVEDALAETKKLVCYDCGIACDMESMREQRVDFLRELGAEKPRTRLPVVESDPAATDRRVMRDVDQGPKARIRIAYRKVGRRAFTSHLDLHRLFARILRRAELPTYLSEGFNPQALVTHGPALSLGLASLAEYVDVTLRARDLGEGFEAGLHDRMVRASFDDFPITAAVVLGPYDASIARILAEAEYVVGLPRAALAGLGLRDEEGLRARIDERLGAEELVVVRDHRGIGKRVDVKRYLLDVRPSDGLDALREAGFDGDLVPFTIRTDLDPMGTAKAIEVARALLGLEDFPCRIVRSALYARDADGHRHTPLDLLPLRRMPSRFAEAIG